jgi:hypothetical protein
MRYGWHYLQVAQLGEGETTSSIITDLSELAHCVSITNEFLCCLHMVVIHCVFGDGFPGVSSD